MNNEIIQCHRCKNEFEANVDDLGTYRCQRCNPERMEEIDPTRLRGMLLKIYMDAKKRMERYKNENINQ